MNASDLHLQMVPEDTRISLKQGHFLSIYRTIFNGVSNELVMLLSDILVDTYAGILVFMNYLYF
jgi:hypothetical protein